MNDKSRQQARDNEVQLINLFTEYLREESERLGNDFYDFALGPQDVELGADWLYHADSRFLLVEYKATKDGYLREADKPRRKTLCSLLRKDGVLRSQHRKCHYIAWATDDYLLANIYEDQVCNAAVFPDTCPTPIKPVSENLIEGTEFASRILAPESALGLPLAEFELYSEWLMKESSGSKDGSLQLVARNRTEPGFRMKRFSSVGELDTWLKQNRPKPSSPQDPSLGPPDGPDSNPEKPSFRM